MMVLIVGEVVARYFFNRPITGTMEITELLLVSLISFGLGYVTHQKGNITVEFFVSRLPARGRTILDAVSSFVLAAFLTIVAWQSVLRAIGSVQTGEFAVGLGTPLYPGRFLLALGWFMVALAMAGFSLRSWRLFRRESSDEGVRRVKPSIC